MNQLNELLYAIRGVYGGIFAMVILAIILIFAITIIFLPLFVWGIHNQTTRTAKELIKLNRNFEGWKSRQLLNESRPKPSPTKLTPEDKQPEQISRGRKVFHKADSNPQDRREKSV